MQCLTAGEIPEGEVPVSVDVPEAGVVPTPLIQPTITTVISMPVGRDERMGTVYMSTMNASMEIMNLETFLMVVGCQGATLEELAEKDLVGAASDCCELSLYHPTTNCVYN